MRTLLLTASVACLLATGAQAGHKSYPKVRTFSGGFYGPTQAHYQYQRRYGRPWHGQGGLNFQTGFRGHGFSSHRRFGWPGYGVSGFGYGCSASFAPGGYAYYGGSSYLVPDCGLFGYCAPPLIGSPLGGPFVLPPVVVGTPSVYTPFWSANPYVNDGLLSNGQLWQQEVPDLLTPQAETLEVEPLGESKLLPPASTPQARLRSLQQQQVGDARLRELDYLQAYLQYKKAVATAADRSEPHYRMGIALAGMKRFDKAVRELKLASELDPDWAGAVSLDELLGEDNQIGKVQLKQRVADWTLKDAHDADRLYLLGTLLHLDGDRERARIMFDTAVALVGNEQHLMAFLTPPAGPPADSGPAPQSDDVPPVPQPPSPPEPLEPEAKPDETPQPPPVGDPVLPSYTAPQGPVFPTRLN